MIETIIEALTAVISWFGMIFNELKEWIGVSELAIIIFVIGLIKFITIKAIRKKK